MKIYIGNLPSSANSENLKRMFATFGIVKHATVVTDDKTDRPRGFGFVEMPISAEANLAINTLNGIHLDGRDIKVDPAIQSDKDKDDFFDRLNKKR